MERVDDSLTLIETKRAGEFSVRLQTPFKPLTIGILKTHGEGELHIKKNERLHLHRNSNSLAVNRALLNHPTWKFRWIVIEFERLNGTIETLTTTRSYFQAYGKSFCSKKAEPQVALELHLWGRDRALRYEQQQARQADLFA